MADNVLATATVRLPKAKATKNFAKFAMNDEDEQKRTACSFPHYVPHGLVPDGTKAVRITVEFLGE